MLFKAQSQYRGPGEPGSRSPTPGAHPRYPGRVLLTQRVRKLSSTPIWGSFSRFPFSPQDFGNAFLLERKMQVSGFALAKHAHGYKFFHPIRSNHLTDMASQLSEKPQLTSK